MRLLLQAVHVTVEAGHAQQVITTAQQLSSYACSLTVSRMLIMPR